MDSYRELKLPSELYVRAEAKFVGSHFATLEDLITFLLQELLHDDSAQMNADEEKIIEERLRDLGYI